MTADDIYMFIGACVLGLLGALFVIAYFQGTPQLDAFDMLIKEAKKAEPVVHNNNDIPKSSTSYVIVKFCDLRPGDMIVDGIGSVSAVTTSLALVISNGTEDDIAHRAEGRKLVVLHMCHKTGLDHAIWWPDSTFNAREVVKGEGTQ